MVPGKAVRGVVHGEGAVMYDREIRAALERHWEASRAGDQDAEHEIYNDDAVVEYRWDEKRGG